MLNRNQDQLCTAMAPQCAKLSVAKIPVDVRIPQHSGHVYFLCPIGSHWFSLICIGSLCWANRCLSAWARSLNPTQTEWLQSGAPCAHEVVPAGRCQSCVSEILLEIPRFGWRNPQNPNSKEIQQNPDYGICLGEHLSALDHRMSSSWFPQLAQALMRQSLDSTCISTQLSHNTTTRNGCVWKWRVKLLVPPNVVICWGNCDLLVRVFSTAADEWNRSWYQEGTYLTETYRNHFGRCSLALRVVLRYTSKFSGVPCSMPWGTF